MKYFFLTEGWSYKRIWGNNGIWEEAVWRRKPHITLLNIAIVENNEILWLHEVEDAILMVEVIPVTEKAKETAPFAQVMLKRLIDCEQVIQTLSNAPKIINHLSQN
jgi:hypothetical protein